MLHSPPLRQRSLTRRPKTALVPGKSSHVRPTNHNRGWLQPSRPAHVQQRRLPLVQSPEVSKLPCAELRDFEAVCSGGNKALAAAPEA